MNAICFHEETCVTLLQGEKRNGKFYEVLQMLLNYTSSYCLLLANRLALLGAIIQHIWWTFSGYVHMTH